MWKQVTGIMKESHTGRSLQNMVRRNLNELEWVLKNGVAAGRIPIREIMFVDKVEDSEDGTCCGYVLMFWP